MGDGSSKGPSTIEAKLLAKPIPGGYTAPGEYEVEYTYANGVRHVCKSTTVNNIFGAKGRDPKPGELPHGVKFEGPDGWLYVTRGKIEASKPELLKDPVTEKEGGVRQRRPHGQLLRVREDPQAADLRRRRSATGRRRCATSG